MKSGGVAKTGQIAVGLPVLERFDDGAGRRFAWIF